MKWQDFIKVVQISLWMVISPQSDAQIRITSAGFDRQEEDVNVFVDFDKPSNTSIMDSIQRAFRTFDFGDIAMYISPLILAEMPQLMADLKEYSDVFNQSNTVRFEEGASFYNQYGPLGSISFLSDIDSIGDLGIEYFYVSTESPFITEITIWYKGTNIYPTIHEKAEQLIEQIDEFRAKKDYNKMVILQTELVSIAETVNANHHRDFWCSRGAISNYYGSLSWYYTLLNKPLNAIEMANKGLELYPLNIWIKTNLAHGYLLNGDIQKAEEIYSSMKSQRHRSGKLYKDIFLEDFMQMKELQINIPEYDRIVQMFSD